MNGRLTCTNCGSGLVPAWTGLRCPRGSACGRGGLVESAWSLRPAGVRAVHASSDARALA